MAGSSTSPPSISPATRWLILILASIGFAFDIYELLMLPLVAPYALPAMGVATGTPEFSSWVKVLFYVPAVFGGIFGLLGGYLTDWLGRRRVLTWSILLYAVSAFLAGYSTTPMMLLILRTTTFIGVCVEFVAAVAWLAELFPNPEEREKALGYSQAFSSLGGLLVAVAFGICNAYGQYFYPIAMPEFLEGSLGHITDPHAPWRYTLMSGLIPAFPLLIIRPFLPESPIWQQKKNAGTLKRPSILALFTTPQMRRTTIVTTILFACSYGVAFGAIQHIPRILPGREDVQEKIHEEVKALSGPALKKAEKQAEGKLVSGYVKVQEIGGLVGRFLFAAIVIYFASQRTLLRVFQFPGLIITPLVFYFFLTMENTTFFILDLDFMFLGKLPITLVSLGVFVVSLFAIAQFSFWGNYLPRVYPLHLRGTGESFAANIGGRMIGTSFAAVTETLSEILPGGSYPERLTLAAAIVGGLVYVVGIITSFFLPEPESKELME